MPEWSKGADLRSAIYGCVGSNPTPCSLHDFLYGKRVLSWSSGYDCGL